MAEPLEGGNRVAASWVGSEGAGRFEVREQRGDFRLVGTFPVSDEADVERVLGTAPRGDWHRLDRGARLERLEEAARTLEARTEDAVASCLGLDPDEGASLRRGFVQAVEEASAGDERTAGERERVLHLSHWTELELPLFRSLLPELLDGAAVLLFGDRRLPVAADALVRALVAAGVGGEDLALLHAPTEDALEHALAHPAVGKVTARGSRRRIAHVRRATPESRPQVLALVRNGDFEVDPSRDLEPQARALVRAAFGRAETLSGQAAGQASRVHCPASVFSRFTELLIDASRGVRDVEEPLPQIDRDAVRVFEHRVALGLDEGATLIDGGVDDVASRRCRAAVFTNVEPRMELWRARRPVPVCLLSRTP